MNLEERARKLKALSKPYNLDWFQVQPCIMRTDVFGGVGIDVHFEEMDRFCDCEVSNLIRARVKDALHFAKEKLFKLEFLFAECRMVRGAKLYFVDGVYYANADGFTTLAADIYDESRPTMYYKGVEIRYHPVLDLDELGDDDEPSE